MRCASCLFCFQELTWGAVHPQPASIRAISRRPVARDSGPPSLTRAAAWSARSTAVPAHNGWFSAGVCTPSQPLNIISIIAMANIRMLHPLHDAHLIAQSVDFVALADAQRGGVIAASKEQGQRHQERKRTTKGTAKCRPGKRACQPTHHSNHPVWHSPITAANRQRSQPATTPARNATSAARTINIIAAPFIARCCALPAHPQRGHA